jgi:transketolase
VLLLKDYSAGNPGHIRKKCCQRTAKIFGMTAGLPSTLLGLVGTNGRIYGMDSFGFSAPYPVLDQKLGFTGENVYKQVKEFLAE